MITGFGAPAIYAKKIDSGQDSNQWECCTDNFLKLFFQN